MQFFTQMLALSVFLPTLATVQTTKRNRCIHFFTAIITITTAVRGSAKYAPKVNEATRYRNMMQTLTGGEGLHF